MSERRPPSLHLLPAAALLVGVALVSGCGGTDPAAFDREGLEEKEDRSESLANDLLAFSIAVRDRSEKVADYFADSLQAGPLPRTPPKPEPLATLVRKREWPVGGPVVERERSEFMPEFHAFFSRFSEIDDVRFKVKEAVFDETGADRGDAHIKFFVVGRDESGNREWLKGTARIEVERTGDEPWRIRLFELESATSKLSETDIFSEVAIPAGVQAVYPPFGVGRNQGFISHGAATADVNGDGLLDIAASGVEQNYLYLNAGDGTFRDISEESLIRFVPTGSGAVFTDYDNDGDADLYFAAVGDQILLENRWVPEGRVRFWDVSEKAGVNRDAVGFSALSADVNGDGYPDLYTCSYNRYGEVTPNSWVRATNGTRNLLFINQQDGTFKEASAEWGVDDGRWTYAAGFVDIDRDGDQDLYVANDFGENALYRNDGDHFTDVAAEMGIVDPGFGMGVSFGDYDNDGDLDLHVTNMSSTAGNRILKLLYPEGHEIRDELSKQAAGNSLYANDGDGTFHEATAEAGGFSGGWAFGGGFIDFNNDGWEDIYTPNGFISGKSMKDT